MSTLSLEPEDWLRRVLGPTVVGQLEVRDRRAGLTRAQQWLLSRLDGQAPLGELGARPGAPATAQLVRDAALLISMGLAHEPGAPRSPPPPLPPPSNDDATVVRPAAALARVAPAQTITARDENNSTRIMGMFLEGGQSSEDGSATSYHALCCREIEAVRR